VTGAPVPLPPGMAEADFAYFAALVERRAGIALTREKSGLLARRLGPRIRDLGLDGFAAYRALVERDPEAEVGAILDAVTTNVTSLFREAHHFELLEEELVRWIREGRRRIRIWSAACSTGEEAWSIAIAASRALAGADGVDLRILATDISEEALARARSGMVAEDPASGVPAAARGHLVREAPGVWRVEQAVRDLVAFRRLNLVDPVWPVSGPFDAVFCRNALIYFRPETQHAVLRRFLGLIRPGGILALGHSEKLPADWTEAEPHRAPTAYRVRGTQHGGPGPGPTADPPGAPSGASPDLPAARPVRVLVVDDSAVMRDLLTSLLAEDPGIEVVGAAEDAHAARELIKRLAPDVLTLDVEMPGMSGIEFLERLMRLRPMPVVMCSTLTREGAATSLRAIELGAVDCVEKPSGDPAEALPRLRRELTEKVRAAAHARIRPRTAAAPGPPPTGPAPSDAPSPIAVAMGASTGGVEAVTAILRRLPPDAPPILLVQHIMAGFLPAMAQRLDDGTALTVRVARGGEVLRRGMVLIAPGDRHLEVADEGGTLRARLHDGPPVTGHKPSVDALFRSAASIGGRAIGVLLTGMGRDGAAGLKAMRDAGARTIVQDDATAVVSGMPGAAIAAGAAEKVLPIQVIATTLTRLATEMTGRNA